MYTLEQFKKDVIQWSTDRLIIQNGSIKGQLQKVREECQEVAEEIKKIQEGGIDKTELKKELGDIAVLLVNIDHMQKADSDFSFLSPPIDPSKEDYYEALNSLGDIWKESWHTVTDYTEAWSILEYICDLVNVNLSECAYLAFKKIEHRKGYFCKESMSFVKDIESKAVTE